MRILIHCHGGPAIGVGHVFRAAALAEAAVVRGHAVEVTGRLEGPLVTDRLAAAGVEVVAAPRLSAYDVVHVDTYEPDGDEVASRAAGTALVSNLEDGTFGRRAADLVIDPNLGAERTTRESGPVLLRGSRWAPLRQSVAERAGRAQVRSEAQRVLVVMGGTDVLGLTGQVLDLLAGTGRDLTVTAITQAAARDDLERTVAERAVVERGLDVGLVPPRPDVAALMLDQDLVVSAAGTSVWELCCLGVPAALVCVTDNQREGYERVLAAGAAVGLGSATAGLDRAGAVAALDAVLGDPGLREAMGRAGRRLVDGLGAWRIVDSWESLVRRPARPAVAPLGVRAATPADGELLLRWRNDPATRGGSRATGEVEAGEHRAWLAAILADPDRRLLVGCDASGTEVGTVRWDRVSGDSGGAAGPLGPSDEWEVSITVAPERRGSGLAGRLLAGGEAWLADHEPSAHTMLAAVHEDNAASLRLFDAATYLPELPADADGFVRLVKQRVPTL